MRRIVLSGLVAFAAAGALAACSGAGDAGSAASVGLSSRPAPSTVMAPSTTPGTTSPGDVLGTGSTSLGTIVVDGTGMTAYLFDQDPAGTTTSACTGACATLWPPIDSPTTSPRVQGVTGTVGTIAGADGRLQVTLDGHPLYTFAQDTAPGDTHGQGVMGIWWVVGPDGAVMGH